MIDGGPMPDPRQLTDEEATQRRRRWLQERHARTRELVVVLLRQAPEAEVVRALDQLPGGELQRLARLLAHASDPPEDAHPASVPSGQAGSSAVTPIRP
jgi:hypothetical protein